MGYRSEIVAGVPLKDKKLALDIIKDWEWTHEEDDFFYMGAFSWKWYPEMNQDIAKFEDFITEREHEIEGRFLLCLGEDGAVHTDYGDHCEHGVYTVNEIHLPFNITIDSCKVWFASDEDAGDVVKFSVMAYDVDSANGSTSGDLSAGAEVCVSPATIDSAGQEQAYYQSLTISTANVDSGKVIIPFVSQDDTNCDLAINMTLVYHLRI